MKTYIGEPQETSLYLKVGGEEGVKSLVTSFYEQMDKLPEAKETRNLHAKSLKASKLKLFKFLSGWLGGPQLYIEEYGHPRLKKRHMPFAIGELEAKQWMLCMNTAMTQLNYPADLQNHLSQLFLNIANFMVNKHN